MKHLFKVIFIILLCSFASCTKNTSARNYGGKVTIELEKDQKLVMCSWKNSSLWILTRVKKSNETCEVYKYSEKSPFGLLEGEITFIEK